MTRRVRLWGTAGLVAALTIVFLSAQATEPPRELWLAGDRRDPIRTLSLEPCVAPGGPSLAPECNVVWLGRRGFAVHFEPGWVRMCMRCGVRLREVRGLWFYEQDGTTEVSGVDWQRYVMIPKEAPER